MLGLGVIAVLLAAGADCVGTNAPRGMRPMNTGEDRDIRRIEDRQRPAADDEPPDPAPGQGSAKTNSVFPADGRNSGVSRLKAPDVSDVPVLTATYCLPSTA